MTRHIIITMLRLESQSLPCYRPRLLRKPTERPLAINRSSVIRRAFYATFT